MATTTPERFVAFVRNQPSTNIAAGLPYGSPKWYQPCDPSDHLPFVVDFAAPFDTEENVISVDQIALSAHAAALGITIDVATGLRADFRYRRAARADLIARLVVFHSPALFDAVGVPIGITFRVKTSATAQRTLERTAIVNVRQLWPTR